MAELTFEQMEAYAENFAISGLFKDTREAEQAFVKIVAGAELGIPPFAAMSGIHIIRGKPSLSANLLASLVRRTGIYDFDVVELNNEMCRLQFYRLNAKGGQSKELGVSVFTINDAKKANAEFTHTSGEAGAWTKFPRNMLYARALSNGVKWFCPDVASGMPVYHHEEMGLTVDQDDNVIDVQVTAKPAPKKQVPKKANATKPAPQKHAPEKPEPVKPDTLNEPIAGAQAKELAKMFSKLGFTGTEQDRETLSAFVNHYTKRAVNGMRDLTSTEAETLLTDADLSGTLAQFIAHLELKEKEE